ncbi:MAG TPA: hypothetical protein VIK65_06855 [Candidatus Limnocylindrales bacterium]|jgi:hypothetical protein
MSWRCPHCSTPQPEASRCWVCHRSSTSCATCRHFRASVAARLGYCGLDRGRQPLAGDEVRACWEDAATPTTPDPAIPGLLDLLTELPTPPALAAADETNGSPDPDAPHRRSRDWVEVRV